MKGRGERGSHVHIGEVKPCMTSCIPAHTIIIMLLSPESRKGCSSVGSVNSERESN